MLTVLSALHDGLEGQTSEAACTNGANESFIMGCHNASMADRQAQSCRVAAAEHASLHSQARQSKRPLSASRRQAEAQVWAESWLVLALGNTQ